MAELKNFAFISRLASFDVGVARYGHVNIYILLAAPVIVIFIRWGSRTVILLYG